MTKQSFTIELDSGQLQTIELALDRLRRDATADHDDTTLSDIENVAVSVGDQQLVAEEVDSIDAGRLSSPSEVDAWNSICERTATPEGRERNSEILRGVVALHYPTTTEKGHN